MLSDPKPDLLRSLDQDDLLPPVSRWTTLGGLFLVSTCGVALALAAVIKYNVTVKATAMVRPAGEIRVVQAAADSTVKRINVAENQMVKQGDIVAYLDDSQLQTERKQLQERIKQGQQQQQAADRQIRAIDTQLTAELNYLNRTIASAQADLTRNRRDYADQQIITTAEVREAAANLQLARDERDRYRSAFESGAIPQLQYAEKERAVEVAAAQLEKARAGLNPNNANVTVARERVAQEQARGNAALANLKRERDTLIQQQIEIASQLNRDRQDLQQTERNIQQRVLRSPVDGTVLNLMLRNPNQVIRSGDLVAQIAPSHTDLVIKALVASQDVGQVKIGQPAQIQISAYPYPDYGVLKGTVSAIAPDATTMQTSSVQDQLASGNSQVNEASGTSGYYEVTIKPVSPYFITPQQQYAIAAGMEGTVNIVSRRETFLSFVLRKVRLFTDI